MANKTKKLGALTSLVGCAVFTISGLVNLNNFNHRGTSDYNIGVRDNSFYSMLCSSTIMFIGLGYLAYQNKRNNSKTN